MFRLFQARLIAIGAQLAAVITAAFKVFVFLRNRIFSPTLPSRLQHIRKPSRYETDPAVRLAIDAVEKIFVRDFKWAFRRLPESGIGIDARAEILDQGLPTGRFLPLQIRAMSFQAERGGDYIHHGEKKHLDYWTMHSLPVCVIVVDNHTGLTLWQMVEKGRLEETDAEWSIAVPPTNLLNAAARLGFEVVTPSDEESLLRSVFALDRALMEAMQDQTAFFLWDEWGDATPIFCNLRIYIGEGPEEEPDLQVDYHLRATNLHGVMARLFPWASYAYAEPIREYSGQVAVHVLEVELRPEARAYIEAETFLESGYPDEEEPWAPEAETFVTEEEEREFWRRRSVRRDFHDGQD
ncbi:DUF4365 domain-containing protein [Rhizobium leguminosarum]|uniref:DUF4365 domain-containing protein n=1 Tax=Rhizobium leguminosarum TaxID=384 RepID=UPI00315CB47C